MLNLVLKEYDDDEYILEYYGEVCCPFPPKELYLANSIPIGGVDEIIQPVKIIQEYEHKNRVVIFSNAIDNYFYLRLPIKI